MYFLKFTFNILHKAFYIYRTRKREEKRAVTLLKDFEKQSGGRLDADNFQKIVRSYALYLPIMCDAFTSLWSRKTNKGERNRMLHYFICSSLFDYFCDENKWTEETIHKISFEPENYIPQSLEEKMFLHSHQLLKEYVRKKETYQKVTHKLFHAQIDSNAQFDADITNEEIERITFEKGGYSVLLCAFYLDKDASEALQNCWYQTGGIIQLTNDLYDIYKDLQHHSETLPNRMKDAREMDDYFSQLIQKLGVQLNSLPYPASHKKELMISLAGICSFGKLAIHRLKRLQGANTQLPDLSTVSRKALIVDMDKPANVRYCIRFVYQQTKEWIQMASRN